MANGNKADMCGALGDVLIVPIADIARAFRLPRRDGIRLSPTSRCS